MATKSKPGSFEELLTMARKAGWKGGKIADTFWNRRMLMAVIEGAEDISGLAGGTGVPRGTLGLTASQVPAALGPRLGLGQQRAVAEKFRRESRGARAAQSAFTAGSANLGRPIGPGAVPAPAPTPALADFLEAPVASGLSGIGGNVNDVPFSSGSPGRPNRDAKGSKARKATAAKLRSLRAAQAAGGAGAEAGMLGALGGASTLGRLGTIAGVVLGLPYLANEITSLVKQWRGTDLESQQIRAMQEDRRNELLTNAMILKGEAEEKRQARGRQATMDVLGVIERQQNRDLARQAMTEQAMAGLSGNAEQAILQGLMSDPVGQSPQMMSMPFASQGYF